MLRKELYDIKACVCRTFRLGHVDLDYILHDLPFDACTQATRQTYAALLGVEHAEGQPMWLCKTCMRALQGGNVPSTSAANNMALAPIPPELQGLTVMETRLISRVGACGWKGALHTHKNLRWRS